MSDWPILSQAIRDSQPGSHEVTVVRDGREITLGSSSPPLTARCSATPHKLADSLGVSPVVELEPLSISWRYPGNVGHFGEVRQALLSFPAKMVGLTEAAFTDQARDPEGPVGVVGCPGSAVRSPRLTRSAGASRNSWPSRLVEPVPVPVQPFVLPLDGGHAARSKGSSAGLNRPRPSTVPHTPRFPRRSDERHFRADIASRSA